MKYYVAIRKHGYMDLRGTMANLSLQSKKCKVIISITDLIPFMFINMERGYVLYIAYARYYFYVHRIYNSNKSYFLEGVEPRCMG